MTGQESANYAISSGANGDTVRYYPRGSTARTGCEMSMFRMAVMMHRKTETLLEDIRGAKRNGGSTKLLLPAISVRSHGSQRNSLLPPILFALSPPYRFFTVGNFAKFNRPITNGNKSMEKGGS